MITEQLHPLVDHLWQSTLFALAAGVLTLAFRNNRAQIRYCLWLSASLKFLIPFSILVNIGGYFGRHAAARTAPSPIPLLVERFTGSFVMSPSTVMSTTPAPPAFSVNGILAALGIVWGIGFLVLVSSWFLRWRHVAAVLRTASLVHLPVNLSHKWKNHEGESTDAEVRGGLPCSSDEAA